MKKLLFKKIREKLANTKRNVRETKQKTAHIKAIVAYAGLVLWHSSKGITLLLLLLSSLGALTIFIELWSITHLIDQLLLLEGLPLENQLANLLPWVAALIGAMLFKHAVEAYKPYLSKILHEKISAKLKNDIFQKALRLSLRSFETEEFYNQLEKSRRSINNQLVYALESTALFITRMIELFIIIYAITQIGVLYALLLLIGSIPLMLQSIRAEKKFIEVNYGQSPERRQLSYWRSLSTTREAATELRLFGLGHFFLEQWKKLNAQLILQLHQARKKVAHLKFKAEIGMTFLLGIVVIGTVYAGLQGSISIGLLVAILYVINRFEQVLNGTVYELAEMTRFYYEFQHVPQFLEAGLDEATTGRMAPDQIRKGITFENVSFTYPGNDQATLEQINLHLPPGEKLAIVGENGAGKSTLALLLLGLFPPTEGRILIDGIDLQDIRPDSWRNSLGAVFQSFMKYQLTAAENIFFGDISSSANVEKLFQAAEESGAAPIIEKLPNRYQTLLGKEYEQARDLSGGEWQKIAIARAYFRQAKLLVLDEPAAALDAKAEFNVYQQFTKAAEGKTVLLISHRLGSARLADRIIYMEAGRITENGSHLELLQTNGAYASLYQVQSEWYQDQEEEGL